MGYKDTVMTVQDVAREREKWQDAPDEVRTFGEWLCQAQAKTTWNIASTYGFEVGLEQGISTGIRKVVELALQAIKDEPEFPSDMPDELWIELNGNRHNTLLSMRNSVRLTKEGITERLEAKLKKWRIK